MPSKTAIDKIKNRAVPALAVHDAKRALDFYSKAFGAKEVSERIPWEGKNDLPNSRYPKITQVLLSLYPLLQLE